ncbi:MAG: hypothetical protein K0Q95_612 [Bacteroidota bacterium]|jgi:hypothetical protein|nr:hypothetical protein [Bacteroidota bacterium]
MKKITITIAAIAMALNVATAQDKAFQKGNITVDLGVGFDIYGTKIHQEILGLVHDTTDAAGGAHFPLKVEYGVTNWLGVGARFNFSSFIDETDSITKTQATTKGLDAGLVLNFHLIKSRRFDMPLSLTFGYSRFIVDGNDVNQTMAKAHGMGYGISLLPRIYFGDHIGMYFNVGYMGYNYKNVIYSNEDYQNLNEQVWQDAKVSIKADGLNMGLGLIVKF